MPSHDKPFLPLELILTIVECLAPGSPTPIALPFTHPTTRTLLSLARTSSIIYPTAHRLLYTHCLCIDSLARLQALLKSLTVPQEVLPRTSWGYTMPPEPPIQVRKGAVHVLECMASLHLSIPTVSQTVAEALLTLFTLLAETLRRLVVDMPFRTFDVGDWFPEQMELRRAFSKLKKLETFCSVRDELYLDLVNPGPPYDTKWWRWSPWSNLESLALYNQDLGKPGFWEDMGQLRKLETLVFTRADGVEEVDIKSEWRKVCRDQKRALEVVLVNVQNDHQAPLGKDMWKDDDKVRIWEINVPTSYYGDDNPIELCQDWVKRRSLEGELPWKWA